MDVTSLWKQYISLLQLIKTYGLGSKVPTPIESSHLDRQCSRQHTTQLVIIEASILELADAVSKMASVLRGTNALTVPTKTNMVTERAGAGKPPPPVLGQSSGNQATTNPGATGKAAPVFYNVANYPPPPPP
eukprot:7147256-Prorocentrum_lima.AAC.1